MDKTEPTTDPRRESLVALPNQLFRHVIPLFTKNTYGRLDPHGTGLLVGSGANTYIISAAHVFDPIDNGTDIIFYSRKNSLQKIDGILSRTKPPHQKRNDDSIDIGVLKLRSNTPPYAEVDKVSLPIARIRSETLPRGDNQYLVTGFPCSKSGLHPKKLKMFSAPYATWGQALERRYPAGLDENTHIAISFDYKRVHGEDGLPRRFPALQGMSGSPIWALRSNLDVISPEAAIVVGIFIEHHREHKTLIATDIGFALDMIKKFESESLQNSTEISLPAKSEISS